MLKIVQISYEEIRSFWEKHLWPEHAESLRPVSTMAFQGGIEMRIKEVYEPAFLGAFWESELAGVNSGHLTSPTEFRSRGLCVAEPFRQRGLGAALLSETIVLGKNQGARLVWSYPRLSSWPVYEKTGFILTDRVLKAGDENRYAYVNLN